MNNDTQIIILAAGKGLRMNSQQPKVLQKLAGTSFLQRIINTSKKITTDINIIYGFGGDILKQQITDNVNWIKQEKQLGTGDAIKQALPFINNDKINIILYGDVPLISKHTLKQLIEKAKKTNYSLLTATLDNPDGYGRIVRKDNKIKAIIEQKDANLDVLKINEINTGIMAIKGSLLHKYIPKLNTNNAQQEFYLTDIVKSLIIDNIKISTINSHNHIEVMGINDKLQLAKLEKQYQVYQANNFLKKGLSIIDNSRFDCRGTIDFGYDCVVDINNIFSGKNTLGNNVNIGANCNIKNTKIGNNVTILANSIIEDCVIEDNVSIGPFAHIRPQTTIKNNTKIGNFVEVKKSIIDKNSKIKHLSYIGDSDIGKNVNIGAGVITCNYDNNKKHKTTIKDNAFIGSNSALIAPITIGQNAVIGAGSAISKNAEENKLTLSRAKQISMKWKHTNKS